MSEIDMRKGYSPVTIIIQNRKKDIMLEEISLVAIDKAQNKIVAVGHEAEQLIETDNLNIVVLCPLKHGAIADYAIAQKMFQYMLHKASVLQLIFKPKIAVCVPDDITEVELKAFEDVFYQAGAKKVLLSQVSVEETNMAFSSSYSVTVGIIQKKLTEQTTKEIWKEICKDKIPPDNYQRITINRNEQGMNLLLDSNIHRVQLKYKKVTAVRMLDKRAIPDELFPDKEIDNFRRDKFRNVIYQIENGEFSSLVKNNERGKARNMNSNHYIIISEHDTIEVLADKEPDIEICNQI